MSRKTLSFLWNNALVSQQRWSGRLARMITKAESRMQQNARECSKTSRIRKSRRTKQQQNRRNCTMVSVILLFSFAEMVWPWASTSSNFCNKSSLYIRFARKPSESFHPHMPVHPLTFCLYSYKVSPPMEVHSQHLKIHQRRSRHQ